MIDEQEIAALARAYGEPQRERHDLDIGPSLFYSRFFRSQERRGEVVFALERLNGRLLLHSKAHYRPGVYRLLSGGVESDEPVLEALHREVEEETGLHVTVEAFIAVLECHLHMGPLSTPFVSYIFHVRESGGRLSPDWFEIDDVQEIWPWQLADVADKLRSLEGERADWGRWRAIAHDIVADALTD